MDVLAGMLSRFLGEGDTVRSSRSFRNFRRVYDACYNVLRSSVNG